MELQKLKTKATVLVCVDMDLEAVPSEVISNFNGIISDIAKQGLKNISGISNIAVVDQYVPPKMIRHSYSVTIKSDDSNINLFDLFHHNEFIKILRFICDTTSGIDSCNVAFTPIKIENNTAEFILEVRLPEDYKIVVGVKDFLSNAVYQWIEDVVWTDAKCVCVVKMQDLKEATKSKIVQEITCNGKVLNK